MHNGSVVSWKGYDEALRKVVMKCIYVDMRIINMNLLTYIVKNCWCNTNSMCVYVLELNGTQHEYLNGRGVEFIDRQN